MEGQIDIHEVITQLYNVHLNSFISKYRRKKPAWRGYTGGLMDIVGREEEIFANYCDSLEEYREELFRSYMRNKGRKVDVEELKDMFIPLTNFYANAFIYSGKEKERLSVELLTPLKEFFDELDKKLEMHFFNKRIEDIINEVKTFRLSFFNEEEYPLRNICIFVYSVDQPQKSKFPQNFFYYYLETDDFGKITMKVPKGTYKIVAPKFGYEEVIEVQNDIELKREIKKNKPKLNERRTGFPSATKKRYISDKAKGYIEGLLGHFLPYGIGVAILFFYSDSLTGAITKFLLPTTQVLIFTTWVLGAFFGCLLAKRVLSTFLVTYMLAWFVYFLPTWNFSISNIERITAGYPLSYSISLFFIFNASTSFVAFLLGGYSGFLLRKKISKYHYY